MLVVKRDGRRESVKFDKITARITVVEKRETRNPNRGILTLDFNVTNQHGETVQMGTNQLMVHR